MIAIYRNVIAWWNCTRPAFPKFGTDKRRWDYWLKLHFPPPNQDDHPACLPRPRRKWPPHTRAVHRCSPAYRWESHSFKTFLQNLDIGRVPFEILLHYAALERKQEDILFEDYKKSPQANKAPYLSRVFSRKAVSAPRQTTPSDDDKQKEFSSDEEKKAPSPSVTDDEGAQAYRALRTATWLSIFYLITTEWAICIASCPPLAKLSCMACSILGPTSSPWAFSQLGKD